MQIITHSVPPGTSEAKRTFWSRRQHLGLQDRVPQTGTVTEKPARVYHSLFI